MTVQHQTEAVQPKAPPAFGRIVCGVDASRSGHDAIEQAISLAGPDTTVEFICVRYETGVGPTHRANIAASRAESALALAMKAASEADVKAASRVVSGFNPAAKLIEEAAEADLLVLASHGGGRPVGIMLGETASTVVHRASVPVLITRRPQENVAFPARILVATDGSPDARRAIRLAACIAQKHKAEIDVLSVDHHTRQDAGEITAGVVALTADLGVEPTVLLQSGDPVDTILKTAASDDYSLLVIGSRGLSGMRALGSVSERVANRAGCSVLVARQP